MLILDTKSMIPAELFIARHPYLARDTNGNFLGRFSNLPAAARSVCSQPEKGGDVVHTPSGDMTDWFECSRIVANADSRMQKGEAAAIERREQAVRAMENAVRAGKILV